ncbi:carbonic anhydrase [Planctomycetota bacterium]|nr:carbonic anhydrase [Planctomycetota bacterium]
MSKMSFKRSLYFVSLLAFVALGGACKTTDLTQTGIKPADAKAELQAGNQRYLKGGVQSHSWQSERINYTGQFGQSPSVGVLTCADSRTPPEMIFDQGIGDLFVVRVAGNYEEVDATATFEYGYTALKMHTIMVLGHTKCGAVNATFDGKPLPGNMQVIASAIAPALAGLRTPDVGANGKPDLTLASEANVRWQAKRILLRSEILRKAKEEGALAIMCAIYDVDTGVVRFIE